MKNIAKMLVCVFVCISLLPGLALAEAAEPVETAPMFAPTDGVNATAADDAAIAAAANAEGAPTEPNAKAGAEPQTAADITAAEAHEITASISTSEGDAAPLTDRQIRTYWQTQTENATATISIPEGEIPGYLRVEWFGECDNYTITELDAAGNQLRVQDQSVAFHGVQLVYSLEAETRKVVITLPVSGSWIGEIYVYSQGTLPDTVHVWQEPYDDVDLMLISAHQDDEFIFMGGTLPYAIANGYKAICTYITSCGRFRRAEALNGLWAIGMRNYPEFINNVDKRPDTVDEMSEIWGGDDAVLAQLVKVIRQYKPEIIVTHDEEGEYGHPAHILTSSLVAQAVQLANDPEQFPESTAEYGVFQVQKLYTHMGNSNEIVMDWKQPLEYYGGKTALEMATIGYEEHPSQHEFYSVEDGGKYDNAKYGLTFSAVGEDVAKNDFFENIVLAVPTPAPTVEPTPAPTMAPTEEPTPTPAPGFFDNLNDTTRWILIGLGAAVALGGGTAGVMALLQKRKRSRDIDDDSDEFDEYDEDGGDDTDTDAESSPSARVESDTQHYQRTNASSAKSEPHGHAVSQNTQVYPKSSAANARPTQPSKPAAQPAQVQRPAQPARPESAPAAKPSSTAAQTSVVSRTTVQTVKNSGAEYKTRRPGKHNAK